MSNDFYEDDEPVEKIEASYAAGEHGVTAPRSHGHTQYLHVQGFGVAPAGANEPTGEPVLH